MDRINTTTRAGVLADGATGRSSLLGRSVGDRVTRGSAAALEDVVEAEVMADFVDGGGALVEARGGAAGDGVGEVDAAIEEEVGGGGVGDGEVAPGWVVSGSSLIVETMDCLPSESATRDIGSEVKVEFGVATLLQSRLHGALSRRADISSSPLGVDGEVGGLEGESNAHAGVGVVHGGDLVVDLGLGVTTLLGRSGDNVDIDGNVASGNTADLLVGSTDSGSLVQLSDVLGRGLFNSTSVVLGGGEARGDGSQGDGSELHIEEGRSKNERRSSFRRSGLG